MTDDEIATKDRILDAARRAFRDRGTAGARMQAIADDAGVNKALLHYYFGTKERLADAVFHRELRRLIQPVIETLGSDAPIAAKVERVVGLYLDTLTEMPGLPAYVLAELNYHPERAEDLVRGLVGADARDVFGPTLVRLRSQIDAEVAAGRMRPIAPRDFVVNLVGLCVFPFAARPLVQLMDADQPFAEFVESRRSTLPAFILGALRP